MILYRNIGEAELKLLLLDSQDIKGNFDAYTDANTCPFSNPYVCAYVDEFEWRDRTRHCFRIILDIDPSSRIFQLGYGEYYISRYGNKHNRWSGKNGPMFKKVNEAYFYKYNYKDVVEVIIYKRYNKLSEDFVSTIKTACKLYNITFTIN